MEFDIKAIFDQFAVEGTLAEHSPIVSGHINDTFLIKTDKGQSYVLQRINHLVFADPAAVMENKILVSQHIESKLARLPDVEKQRRMLTFCETRSGEFIYRDQAGNFWNLSLYIEDSIVHMKTPEKSIAFEAGKAFGEFLAQTADLDPGRLHETLKDFHSMRLRYRQFDEACGKASDERVSNAKDLIDTANTLRDEMQQLERWISEGKIPFRVTHNDTKISNALFSTNGEALCVIDLDTVMRGVVHYDFGDAVRTICGSADEDEPDISKVGFSLEYFESFAAGFLGASGIRLSKAEVDGLALSGKIMSFIVGLRFLTDYLNNDVYFDTKYETHNLVRARNQFRLAALIDEHLETMQQIVVRAMRKEFQQEGTPA